MARSTHTLSGIALFVTAAPLLALDLNGNSQCDVWEARYHAVGLAPDADADGDGHSNAAEALAGTDPWNGVSFPNASIAREGDNLRVTIAAEPGKRYRLVSAATPGGPWNPTGTMAIATTSQLEFVVPVGGIMGFFKVATEDVDSDGDGLTDWAELQLAGFDRQNVDTFGLGTGNDLTVATGILQTLRDGGITVASDAAVAYEKDGSPAELTFTRAAAANYPFTLFLKPAKASDPTKSSATNADYSLNDTQNQTVGYRFVIPAGQASAKLTIKPTLDTKVEVPEQLRLLLGGTTQSASVTISDAKNTPENQRLLVAYLHPLEGVVSVGSGIATARLQGDNDVATVTVSFSNLNSAVNSTQVLNSGSSILQSVPPANYGGQPWSIRASQSFTTDQAVLDALLAGGVKLGVFTQENVNGEIEGPFQASTGSTEFQTPAPPDPIANLTGSELDRDIVRFLTQATYGPTPDAIAELKARVEASGGNRIAAYGQWIDDQFALPSPSLREYTIAANRQEIEYRAGLPTTDPNYNAAYDPNNANRRRGWWMFALSAPDQLRQRAAFALSEIFVISDTNSLVYERSYGSAHYYDMLRTGASGSYRSLIEGVSTHPMMGYYLSHLRNQKAVVSNGVVTVSPDENYAREIMQLFSIGLVQLHPDGSLKLGGNGLPIPTYNQTDITEMARVFTGWSFREYNNPSTSTTVVPNPTFNRGNGSERFESQWMAPMLMFPAYHDVAAKSVLGLSLPAGQTGEKDLADVLDFLSSHPNTAPFICRRLIQRFTSANPSAGYLYRVSTAFRDSGGNLATTIKAILLDPEVRSTSFALDQASAGKTREPLLRTTAFLRAFGGKSQLLLSDLSLYGYPSGELAKFPPGTTRARISSTSANLFQTPMSAPSVFNFYSPDYSPAGLLAANGIVSPELQLANENSVIQAGNYLYSPIYGTLGATNLLDQTLPPYNYTSSAQNLALDVTPLTALYLGVVDKDVNGVANGIFDKLDVGAFNKPVELRKACEAVLDRVDFLLCAGELKARYGDTPGQPRQIILDAALSIRSANNTSTDQTTVTRDRIRTILWLVMSSPECAIQK